MPQFDFTHPIAFNGQIATSDPRSIASYINELLAQETEVPIGGTTDGTYVVQIEGEEGTFTFQFIAVGQTADQIADGLAAAVLADDDFLNIVVASSTSGTPLELDFIHPGRVYTISFPTNPGGNMSEVVIQAAGGAAIGLGLGVVQGSADDLGTAPVVGSVAANVLGITVRSLETQVNAGVATDIDRFEAGSVLSVMRTGEVWVRVEDAVTANVQAFMRRTNATLTNPIGGLRSDAGGGDAITIPGLKYRTSTTAAGLARVRVSLLAK